MADFRLVFAAGTAMADINNLQSVLRLNGNPQPIMKPLAAQNTMVHDRLL
jgi:hypothetical protein